MRLRLALLYSGLFLLAGAALLAVAYGLVAQTWIPGGRGGHRRPRSAGSGGQDLRIRDSQRHRDGEGKAQAEQSHRRRDRPADAPALTDPGRLLDDSLATLAALALGSAWLGWIMAGRALRPVHAITAAARRASQENLGERIALAGPDDELKELADTFDAMLARLDAAFASQRRFVANASHELRTPLTVMRTAIDVTLAKPEPDPGAARGDGRRDPARRGPSRSPDRGAAHAGPQRPRHRAAERLDLAVLAEDALDAAAPDIGALRSACRPA